MTASYPETLGNSANGKTSYLHIAQSLTPTQFAYFMNVYSFDNRWRLTAGEQFTNLSQVTDKAILYRLALVYVPKVSSLLQNEKEKYLKAHSYFSAVATPPLFSVYFTSRSAVITALKYLTGLDRHSVSEMKAEDFKRYYIVYEEINALTANSKTLLESAAKRQRDEIAKLPTELQGLAEASAPNSADTLRIKACDNLMVGVPLGTNGYPESYVYEICPIARGETIGKTLCFFHKDDAKQYAVENGYAPDIVSPCKLYVGEKLSHTCALLGEYNKFLASAPSSVLEVLKAKS